MAFAALMSFFPGIISFIAILFFIWNFLNKRAFPIPTFIFFTIAIGINIYFIAFVDPLVDKFHKRMDQAGYNVSLVNSSQDHLNLLARIVEDYKSEKGEYPVNLNEIPAGALLNYDPSFRVVTENGDVIGTSFLYKKLDNNKFLLAGAGEDGIFETQDDLVPQIFEDEEPNTGLVKYSLKPRP